MPRNNAIKKAWADIDKGNYGPIPRNLQNKHYDGDDVKNKGQFYIYPHDYPDHYVEQQYKPYELNGKEFYNPTGNGYELKIRDHMKRLKNRDKGEDSNK